MPIPTARETVFPNMGHTAAVSLAATRNAERYFSCDASRARDQIVQLRTVTVSWGLIVLNNKRTRCCLMQIQISFA